MYTCEASECGHGYHAQIKCSVCCWFDLAGEQELQNVGMGTCTDQMFCLLLV
jgi:hypothetical protein